MSGRYRAVWKDGKLFAEYEGDELTFLAADYQPPKVSHLAAPTLIRDQTEPFKSMADGRMYDSKSAYRHDLKSRGLVELGNDAPVKPPPTVMKDTRREVLHKVLADTSDREANKLLKGLKKEFAP